MHVLMELYIIYSHIPERKQLRVPKKCVQNSKINSKTYSQLYLLLMSHIISF